MPSRLDRLFADYSSAHQTSGNRLCHGIGIPLIAVSLLGLLSRVGTSSFPWDAGMGLIGLAGAWYLFLDWRLGLPFLFFAVGMYSLGHALPMGAQLVGFALGWIIQYVGHLHFEKNQPAFYRNVRHFLVGPLWVFSHWTDRELG